MVRERFISWPCVLIFLLPFCQTVDIDCQDYDSFASLGCTEGPTTQKDTTQGISSTLSPISTTISSLVTTHSPIEEEVNKIVNTNITMANIEVISDELVNVTEKSTTFDEELLESVTDKLRSIVGFASEQNLTEDVILQVSESVIGAVDNILNIPESTFETTSSKQVSNEILTTISILTEVIQKTSTNNFTYSGSNIILAVVKVDRTSFPLRTAIGGAGNDVIDISTDEGTMSNMADVAYVTLPSAILPLVPDDSKAIPVSVFLVNSPKLFQGDRPSSSSIPSSRDKQNQQPKITVVASPILTVTIEGTDIKDLPDNESITFVFPVNQSSAEKYNGTNLPARCVFWDITLEEWSDEGCKIDKTTFTDMVACRCNHLTSFAVLLDIKGSLKSQVIDLISRIGCIASIVCLSLTISILLGFRKLRGKRPQQIIVNLCFALLCLYVIFVIGIDRPTWRISCTVVAILLHYFCLASLAWMGVEAFSMYMSFVRVMDTYIPKLLLKCCLVGWGIPFMVVIATVASKWTAYQNSEYCFLLPGPSLYFGLILPIGLILTCNCITFTIVIYKLTCGRKTFSATSTRLSKKERGAKTRIETIRRAQNAVAIGTLLGLTWVFGFLAVGDGRMVFGALFAFLNSLQGVFVFLLFGIRQPEVKEKLRATRMRLLQSVRSARRGSDFWTSSSEARMDSRPSDVTIIQMEKKH
ncbi:adhesion G-protein coupled receptor G2 isoform X3 [Strongylocentrotus purpuratus]|uniref:Uncharacterized protein n=1 Tax=Strongylocentrotus purpuratus TaxID=7668 RepID=A0A7M7PDE1_STRPU|nr:adhesion G-protein coupled receptor G2 isoform X3 [Strongylocentrotus purpuratus]